MDAAAATGWASKEIRRCCLSLPSLQLLPVTFRAQNTNWRAVALRLYYLTLLLPNQSTSPLLQSSGSIEFYLLLLLRTY